MNKEDYVSLEVAKMLKEKGYDEPYETEVNIYLGTWAYCDYDHVGARNSNLPSNKASYPTLYEAQKWLRERGVFIEVMPHYSHKYEIVEYEYKITTYFLLMGKPCKWAKSKEYYEKYEQALNEGIKEALKLI